MTTIKSDLMNQTLPSRPMREISVSDESRQINGNLNIDFDAVDSLMRERGMPPVDRNAMQNQYNLKQQAKRGGFSAQEEIDLEQQIKEAKRVKASGKERLSSKAKERIEMLCGISRMQRTVNIDNNEWVLQTLKGKDQREIWVAAAEMQNTVEFPFELRKHTLARSLISIAGTDLEMFIGTDELDAKLDFIELQDEEVLNRLYAEFNLLVDETKSKHSIKSDAEASEVIADLKK